MPRADLHVHSCHSTTNGDLPFLKSRDCYSSPLAVYRQARARGMDFVTITDHDSIDGCLELMARRPEATDIIIGEEISCRVPDTDLQVHLGAYGVTETIHRDVQPLRGNVFEVAAYLRQAEVFFSLNHLFHFYRAQVPLDRYLRLLAEIPGREVRNGTMLRAHNALVDAIRTLGETGSRRLAPPVAGARGAGGLVSPSRPAPVAGSDAHTLRRIGTTWTEAPGETAQAFLAHVAGGRGRAGGRHGTSLTIAGDAYGVIWGYCKSLVGIGPQDHSWGERAVFLATAVGSLPLQWLPLAISLAGKQREGRHVARWTRRLAPWLEASRSADSGPVPGTALADEEAAP